MLKSRVTVLDQSCLLLFPQFNQSLKHIQCILLVLRRHQELIRSIHYMSAEGFGWKFLQLYRFLIAALLDYLRCLTDWTCLYASKHPLLGHTCQKLLVSHTLIENCLQSRLYQCYPIVINLQAILALVTILAEQFFEELQRVARVVGSQIHGLLVDESTILVDWLLNHCIMELVQNP